MNVELLSYTPEPEELIAQAYGICTGKDTIPVENITRWIERGHVTPIEHASATFHISGISRACSHQLVRHRLASFSQRSQRYCTEENWEPVRPSSIEENVRANHAYYVVMEILSRGYQDLRALGIPDEDARFLLPNATPTELMMTANFREWRHVIELRGTSHAQWEIRELAFSLQDSLYNIAPHVFGASYE